MSEIPVDSTRKDAMSVITSTASIIKLISHRLPIVCPNSKCLTLLDKLTGQRHLKRVSEPADCVALTVQVKRYRLAAMT